MCDEEFCPGKEKMIRSYIKEEKDHFRTDCRPELGKNLGAPVHPW